MSSRFASAWLIAGAIAVVLGAFASGAHTPVAVPASAGAPPTAPAGATPTVFLPERVGLAFEAAPAADGHFVARGLGAELRVAADGATFRPGDDTIRMHVIGADAAARPVALDTRPGRSHYFVGNDPSRWRRDVATHGKVRFEGVYPGIDLDYYGNQRDLEYDFVVAPGADPGIIAIGYSGIDRMRLDEAGDLVLSTGAGDLVQRRPVVYQDLPGGRRVVEAAYALRDGVVGFVLGEYDAALALVIDPVITYSTFVGGSWSETGVDVAVDPQGYFYVAGDTASEDFPVVAAPQPAPGGDRHDMFVAKYAPDGQLVYATYLGSSGFDRMQGIDVDASGRAYVTGITDGADFPVANPLQAGPLSPGGRAVFVTRIAPGGELLEFSSYLGGSAADYGEAIAVDDQGNAYVTGGASYGFPTTPGVIDPTTQWGDDVFVAKVDTSAGALVYSTYIDGPDTGSTGRAIAIDAQGNAYVAGTVSGANFPNVGGFQGRADFNGDAFLAKLDPSGTALLYSTYYGGTDYDYIYGVDVDAAGNAYVAGLTWSDDLPLKGPIQATGGGSWYDAFVAKIDTVGGAGLVYATYLGGSKDEGYHDIGIAVDGTGSAYVAGSTYSSDFPVVDAIQPQIGGSRSGFLARLAPDGGSLLFSTYIGAGTYSQSQVNAVAVDGQGNAYVTGVTDGSDFPVVAAAQPTLNDDYIDAFVMRISLDGGLPGGRTARPDFDGDGRDDLVWRHSGSGANAIWLGARATVQKPMADVRNTDWAIQAVGDFGGDGVPDIFWRNTATGVNLLWHGADAGSQQRLARVSSQQWQVSASGDLDGDGTADLVWSNATEGRHVVWPSGLRAQARSLPRVAPSWRIGGVADFDGDGRDDLYWRNWSTGAGVVWPAGDPAQAWVLRRITSLAWRVVAFGDYDADGEADLFWRNVETGANAIWPSADYAARRAVTGIRNLGWEVVASGRYDGDATDDLFWRHATTGYNVVWRSGESAGSRPERRVADAAWRVVP